jgi:hypothetical protein
LSAAASLHAVWPVMPDVVCFLVPLWFRNLPMISHLTYMVLVVLLLLFGFCQKKKALSLDRV